MLTLIIAGSVGLLVGVAGGWLANTRYAKKVAALKTDVGAIAKTIKQ